MASAEPETLDDGRSMVIDRRITNQLGDWEHLDGQRVDKAADQRTVRVGRQRAHLAPSVEFWKVLGTFIAVAVAVAALAVARARRAVVPADRPSTG